MSLGSAPPDRSRRLARYARAAAVGFEFVGTVAAGALVGIYGDRRLETHPWLSIAGVVLGTIGGLYRMVQVQRFFQRQDEDRQD